MAHLAAVAEGQENPRATQLARAQQLLSEPGKTRAWRAAEVCAELCEKPIKELVGQEAAPSVLAQALALRAVAELRQGKEERARWRLAEAASFAPASARETLRAFADAWQAMESWFSSLDRDQNLDRYTALPANHIPPNPVQLQPLPTMSSSLARHLLTLARVLLRVSAQGLPEAPLLLQSSGDVSFDWPLMEGLRGWVFTPASQEGHPVVGS